MRGFNDVQPLGGLSNKPLGSQVMSPVGSWSEPDEWDKAEATAEFEDMNDMRLEQEEFARFEWAEKHRYDPNNDLPEENRAKETNKQ